MTWFRSRRGLLVLLGFLLVILFVMRPGVDRLRTRIARSISSALGREVEISSASLRLLPQPGFDLENFIVHDDPAFSVEPMLRSDEVTASLRITSLLRGRLEISRLSLAEPSLNLVRNNQGHWNLESLLDRVAKTPIAPTEKPKSETRPAFPYIEADRGRINCKFGLEKKQFALTEADFALFQDSENTWGIRLRAKPVRTDANLSDTGLLKITGSWQRAQSLSRTPLHFDLQWEHSQLGQASKLIFGNDKGWRGTASVSAEINGTPADLAITSDGSVDDFKRYDILGENPLRLRVQCGGHYSSTTQSLSAILCDSPVGNGALSLRGIVAVSLTAPAYQLTMSAQEVPLQALLELARHSKKEIPDDLLATGTLDATVKVQRKQDAGSAVVLWEGNGETSELRLQSHFANSDLSVGKIRFGLSSASAHGSSTKKITSANQNAGTLQTRVDVSPFAVGLGEPRPAMVQGWFSRSGYDFSINGDAQLQALLRAGKTVGITSPQFAAEGKTRVDLQIADMWSGFNPPKVMGKAELHSVKAKLRGLNAPIEINAAEIMLEPDQVNVTSLTASAAETTWYGSLLLPRPCVIAACSIHFDLHADEIGTDSLNKLFNPQYSNRPWYHFLTPAQAGKPYFIGLRATGHLSAGRVKVRRLVAAQVSADVDLNKGKVQLSNLRGAVFGGSHNGQWTADFTVWPPEYSGSGTLQHFALSQFAAAMQDDWISGTATATYHAAASGLDAAELYSSATAILQVEASNGFMPHIELRNFSSPLQLHHFEGSLILRHAELGFENAKLETPDGIYQLTGTASLNRVLKLKLVRSGTRGFNITGTLRQPIVSITAIPETQAALKP